jgi:cell division protein FtsL
VIKVNIVLSSLLVLCALAMVTSQHEARKLFTELTREEDLAKQMDVEWGQLQLEQSTWAMHARIETIASGYLRMRVPAAARVRLISVEPAAKDARRSESARNKPQP